MSMLLYIKFCVGVCSLLIFSVCSYMLSLPEAMKCKAYFVDKIEVQ